VATVGQATLDHVLAEHLHLGDEQRVMVRRLTTSGAGVDVVVGRAGTGKTTALAAASRAWEADGFAPLGTSLSARAAEGLGEGAGIPSSTLARLLADIDRGTTALTERSVVVVDEAGMVSTRMLEALLSSAGEVGAKVVLVGDPRQLPEIGAGGTLAALAEQLGAVELSTNRRQEQSWERAALDQLRHGSVHDALSAMVGADRVHAAPTMDEARRRLVASWLASVACDEEAVMLAVTRRDVAELNDLARAALRTAGRLGPDVLTVAGRGFAVGDVVVCGRNDSRLDVINGTRGSLASIEGGSVVLDTAQGPRWLSPDYLERGHLTHGYALTVHKSQGATVDRAFVLVTASLTREAGYVAMSRARRSTELFVATSPVEDGVDVPEHHHRVQERADHMASLAARLGVSRAKQLATIELDCPHRPVHPVQSVSAMPTPPPSPLDPPPVHPPPSHLSPVHPSQSGAGRYLEAVMGPRPAFRD